MTYEEKLKELLDIEEKLDIFNLTREERGEFQNWVKELLESANKGEPTDEEVIRYCNKRGYIIVTQEYYNRSLSKKPRIEFAGYVGVDGKIIHPE